MQTFTNKQILIFAIVFIFAIVLCLIICLFGNLVSTKIQQWLGVWQLLPVVDHTQPILPLQPNGAPTIKDNRVYTWHFPLLGYIVRVNLRENYIVFTPLDILEEIKILITPQTLVEEYKMIGETSIAIERTLEDLMIGQEVIIIAYALGVAYPTSRADCIMINMEVAWDRGDELDPLFCGIRSSVWFQEELDAIERMEIDL
jgi:hypothetical protein